eukprot:10086-Eustigmatos_ZCMA.PRE.1
MVRQHKTEAMSPSALQRSAIVAVVLRPFASLEALAEVATAHECLHDILYSLQARSPTSPTTASRLEERY